MSLVTIGFDTEGSFRLLIDSLAAGLSTDLTAGLGRSISIATYHQALPQTYPAILTALYAGGGTDTARNRSTSAFQVVLAVKSDDPQQPDQQLLTLMRDSFQARLDLANRGQGNYHAFFDVHGHFANAGSPSLRSHARLEYVNPRGGWGPWASGDPQIQGITRDFKILY